MRFLLPSVLLGARRPTLMIRTTDGASRAARCTAYERYGKPFFDQDRANVATVGFQDAAISPIIAGGRSLCSDRAGTGDIFEIEIARRGQDRGGGPWLLLLAGAPLRKPLAASQAH